MPKQVSLSSRSHGKESAPCERELTQRHGRWSNTYVDNAPLTEKIHTKPSARQLILQDTAKSKDSVSFTQLRKLSVRSASICTFGTKRGGCAAIIEMHSIESRRIALEMNSSLFCSCLAQVICFLQNMLGGPTPVHQDGRPMTLAEEL